MCIRVTLIVVLSFITGESYAQFWKKKKAKETEVQQQPTSLDPSVSEKEYTPKASRRSSKGPTYGLEEEYYERMEDLEKTRRKNERLMEKPQYSNPSYFGHKHPPKKRKPSRMKFCKVCGIRH
ncbi:MAG: hypothetical protein WD824_15070 [Cyclobacteriaceae bacterium]